MNKDVPFHAVAASILGELEDSRGRVRTLFYRHVVSLYSKNVLQLSVRTVEATP